MKPSPCPNCGNDDIYLNKTGIRGNGMLNYLPGLGVMRAAKLYPAICEDCGLVRFFIDKDARSKLKQSEEWEKQEF